MKALLCMAVLIVISLVMCDGPREPHPCDGLTGEAMTSCGDYYQQLNEREDLMP